jgi:hypothetical protein
MPQFSKACLLLVTFLLPIAFPAWAETSPDERPQVVVSVYNDAGISATVLVQAEQQAAKIFDHAGLDVVWKDCSPSRDRVGPDAPVRAGERNSPGSDQAGLRAAGRVGAPAPTRSGLESLDCASFEWPTHLAVRVVPQSRLSTNEVFGVAFLSPEGTGCYSDVFYDRVAELHANWNVALADILGNVIAHELGHLLLGSNSHASMGIMRAHWQGEELRRLSRGSLSFTNEQTDHMRGELISTQRKKSAQIAASTRSAF